MLERAEKPLPKLLPRPPASLYHNDTDKGLDLVISLPLQRFYSKAEEAKSSRIPISLNADDQSALVVPTINTKLAEKTTWESDPLRLCLIDGSATSSPIQLQAHDNQIGKDEQLLSQLYVAIVSPDTDYVTLASALPYASSAYIAPSPPPKPLLKTSLSLLPVESYAPLPPPPTAVEPWFYSLEEDQSVPTTASPTIASVFLFDEDTKGCTEETWEAIFHPLSTFRHKKGELEYCAWNSTNLSQAAARVAQRVIHARAHDTDILSSSDITVEATIPRVMSTPSPTHTPELMLNENKTNESQLTLPVAEERHYYDMLQKIRGGQRYSHDSSIDSQLYSDSQDDSLSIRSDGGSHDVNRVKSDALKQSLVARIASASSLSAFFLTNTQNEEKNQQQDPETLTLQKPHYWTEKRLFWIGFVCPLLWYYGSFHIGASSRTKDLRWQKRCRMAALYFSIVLSVVILVVSVKAAGAAGARQAQSDTIRAVIAN
jgi:hypothetical protein